MAAKVSEEILRQAWLGDAVLALYARQRILDASAEVDGDRASRMTSNQFLTCRGEPSHVEAEIGKVYATEGLDAAFAWIQTNLMPLFDRQEERRSRGTRRHILPK